MTISNVFLQKNNCLSVLSFSSTAPGHLHATRVAVYPALFDYVIVTMTMCLVVSSLLYGISWLVCQYVLTTHF